MIKSSLLFLGLYGALCLNVTAQMVDIVTVKLPYAATVGNVTLPPGEYTIRDLKEDGSAPVLEIRSVNANGPSTMVMPSRTPNNQQASHTQVVLRHEGKQYQIDKIFLQGRDFGYELPPAASSRESALR